MIRKNITLTPTLIAALKRESKNTGLSASAIIRRAVEAYLKRG